MVKKRMLFFAVAALLAGVGTVCASAEQYICKLTEPLIQNSATLFSEKYSYDLYPLYERENIYAADGEMLSALAASGLVEYAEPNYRITLFDAPRYTAGAKQWGLSAIRAPSVWRLGCYGSGTKIAVIDSGAYPHPDLAGRLLPGYNYIDHSSDTGDQLGHGTAVAGVIAASGSMHGTLGVAPQAEIVPLKCFGDTKYGELSDIVTAIYDAVDTYECDVLNMSFGMEQESAFLNNALRYALSKGVIAVAAVGNEGSAALHYPAACEGVIGVSSVDKVKTVSAFSQKNESVFVAAPGEAVLLLGNSAGQYGYSQGTSYAAPVVSALAAVAYELDEDMTPVRFANVLQNTCEDLGTAGYDTEYGYGLVNTQNMLDYLLRGRDCFVSQPNKDSDGRVCVTIYNNNDAVLSFCSIWADYAQNGTMLQGVKKTELLLQGKSTATVSYDGDYTKLKHFLWYDTARMCPAYTSRVIKYGEAL